jgi:hypothetical protein
MRWRRPTRVFIVWTVFVAAYLVYFAFYATSAPSCSPQFASTAECGVSIEAGIIGILFVWLFVAVPPAIIWFATGPKRTFRPPWRDF